MKADWKKGVWTAEDGGVGKARVTIASDWLPLRQFEHMIRENPLEVYGDLLPLIRNSDLNIVNVESPLGICGEKIVKVGPAFRAEEQSVRSLTEVPFHVA